MNQTSLTAMLAAAKAAKLAGRQERRVLSAEQLEKLRTRNRLVAAVIKESLGDTSWMKYVQVYDITKEQAKVESTTEFGFIVVPFVNVRVTFNDPGKTKIGFAVNRIFKSEYTTDLKPSKDNPDVMVEQIRIISTVKTAIQLFSPGVCERDGLARSVIGWEKHLYDLMLVLENLSSLDYLSMIVQYIVAMTPEEEAVLTDVNTLTAEECKAIFAEFVAANTTPEQN